MCEKTDRKILTIDNSHEIVSEDLKDIKRYRMSFNFNSPNQGDFDIIINGKNKADALMNLFSTLYYHVKILDEFDFDSIKIECEEVC